jgi:hypothetical protein
MNYAKIQEILESEASFKGQVSTRDTKGATRGGGEAMYSALAVRVGNMLTEIGSDDKSNQKAVVLALAMRAVSSSAPPPPASPPPPKPRTVVATEEPVKVTSVPSPALQANPVRQQQKKQGVALDQFVDRNEIARYQSSIAISQLLAAVWQLAESDTWTGHERRKSILGDLMDEYEVVAKQHINLSVKQLIRAKAEG